jgi:TP901 family phage tail tape measure protein
MDNVIRTIFTGDTKSLESAITRSGKTIASYSSKTVTAFNRIGKTLGHISSRYMTGFNTLIGGAGLLYAGKNVMDLNARIARLAITSGKSGKEFMKFKSVIFDVAKGTNQSADEVVDFFSTILEKTGNFDLAMQTVKNAGIVAAATGSSMADIGSTVANIWEKMDIGPKQTFEALDILNMQAKAGAVEFANFAGLMERLTSASSRFNAKGIEGIRVLGAWVQEAKKTVGSAEEATTSIENLIAETLNPAKIKLLKKYGFNPIDRDATKKAGVTVLKDMKSIIKGIVTATKGDEIKLGSIYGIRSVRALSRIADVYRQTGGFGELDSFISQGGDGAETMKDFAFWTAQTTSKLKDLRTNLSEFSNINLAAPIEYLTNAFDYLIKHPAVTKGGLWALLGLGGVMVGAKMISSVKTIFDFLRGGGSAIPGRSGGLGGLGGIGGPIPVYVVNRHLSMLPGQGWGFPGGDKGGPIPGTGPLTTGGKVLSALKWAGAGAASFSGGYMLGSWIDKVFGFTEHGRLMRNIDDLESEKVWASEQLKKRIDAQRASGPGEVKNQNNINLSVRIDKNGRTFSETNDMNTYLKLDTGDYFEK